MPFKDPDPDQNYGREGEFSCRFCNENFTTQTALESHQQRDHDEEVEREEDEERIWAPVR